MVKWSLRLFFRLQVSCSNTLFYENFYRGFPSERSFFVQALYCQRYTRCECCFLGANLHCC